MATGEAVVVTGAPGWLGTRLVEALVGQWKVPGVEYRPGRVRCLVQPGIQDASLRALGVELVTGDLRVPESLRSALDRIQTVFHLAGVIHPRRVRDLYAINTFGTMALAQMAAEAGARRFIYVSSNSPAGMNKRRDRPFEGTEQDAPYMAYGRSKKQAEEGLLKISRETGLEAAILRPCWYYGPRQPERQTRFFRMIKTGRPILFGDGSNLRSLSYIDNVVQGLLLAAVRSNAAGKVYWTADERPYTILEIYSTIARLLGVRDLRPIRVPALASHLCGILDGVLQGIGLYIQEIHVAGEMAKTIACSIEVARRELGYHPTVSLEEGMRRSIEWCREAGVLD